MSFDTRQGRLYYHRLPEFARKENKLDFLSDNSLSTVDWQRLVPNQKHTWRRTDTEDEFDSFLPIGSKEAKRAKPDKAEAIFKTYARGVQTGRDAYAYDFVFDPLAKRMRQFVQDYNSQVAQYHMDSRSQEIDDFVDYEKIKWGSFLKQSLKRGKHAQFSVAKIRESSYRPFTRKYIFFDRILNEAVILQPYFFPDENAQAENQMIQYKVGADWPQYALMVNRIPDLMPQSGSQCFPFYTYDEDGANRRENITDWALDQFRSHYNDPAISKWDVFYYVYGLLHHPGYRERYALDLKRNLPRIPFAPNPHPKPLPGGSVSTRPHKEGGASTAIEKWDISPELDRRMQLVARELRKNPTSAEEQLWQSLRKRQLSGRKFRRQVAIGAFVVDFYCASERLAVEVDGPVHDAQVEVDRIRQELIESLGIRFIRLRNDQVENELQNALEKIRAVFLPDSDDLSSPSLILGEGAGGWGQENAFHAFSQAGRQLADLHLNYESADRYPLDWQSTRKPVSYRVEKMLPKGKVDSAEGAYKVYHTLKYNDTLTLHGIPERAFAYRLGNRSALDWIVDQYRVKTDKRSGITHDPNGYSDDPQYILKLIERVITVSLRTVDINEGLSKLPFRRKP